MKATNTVLNVEGMSCGSCVRHVDTALKELEGVTRVDVRLREGKVSVQYDADVVALENLMQALREAGYEASAAA